MPRKRKKNYASERQARRKRDQRRKERETPQQKALRLILDRERKRIRREAETTEEAELKSQYERERQQKRRASETPQQTELRLQRNRERQRRKRERETPRQTELRLRRNREIQRRRRENETPQQRALRLIRNRERVRRKRSAKATQEATLYNVKGKFAAKSNCTSMTVLKSYEGKKHSQSSKKINPRTVKTKNPKKGRRIIDVEHFFNAIKCIDKHNKFGCSLNDVVITDEKKVGLCTSFVLKCSVCNFQQEVYSETISEDQDLNVDFIEGMLSLNFDFNDINSLLSKLLLPSLTPEFFVEQLDKLSLDSNIEVPEKSTDQSANFPTACAKKRKRPRKTFRKSSALKPASFLARELDEMSETTVLPQIETNQCTKTSKSPKVFRGNLALEPQSSAFSVKECDRISSTLMAEVSLKTTDQSVFSPVLHPKKNKPSEVSEKPLEQNLQRVVYQGFNLADSANEIEKIQTDSQASIVQGILSSASDISKTFHQNDSVGLLLVEDQFQIKEENAIEKVPELIVPDLTPEKSSSNELVISQEPAVLDIMTAKQEINSEFDDEQLHCLETSKMDSLSEKNLPESNNQSIAVLCQQKKVSSSENRIVVDQKQAILDVTTIKREINADVDDETWTATAQSRESYQNMPETNENDTMFLSLKPHDLASGPYQGINGAAPTAICQASNFLDYNGLTYLSSIPTRVQQAENFPSSEQPSTSAPHQRQQKSAALKEASIISDVSDKQREMSGISQNHKVPKVPNILDPLLHISSKTSKEFQDTGTTKMASSTSVGSNSSNVPKFSYPKFCVSKIPPDATTKQKSFVSVENSCTSTYDNLVHQFSQIESAFLNVDTLTEYRSIVENSNTAYCDSYSLPVSSDFDSDSEVSDDVSNF